MNHELEIAMGFFFLLFLLLAMPSGKRSPERRPTETAGEKHVRLWKEKKARHEIWKGKQFFDSKRREKYQISDVCDYDKKLKKLTGNYIVSYYNLDAKYKASDTGKISFADFTKKIEKGQFTIIQKDMNGHWHDAKTV